MLKFVATWVLAAAGGLALVAIGFGFSCLTGIPFECGGDPRAPLPVNQVVPLATCIFALGTWVTSLHTKDFR